MANRTSQATGKFIGVRGIRKPKLVVQRNEDDPDIRYYSVNRRLMPAGQMVELDQISESIAALPEEVPLEVKNLCDELLRIEGLEEISVEGYCIFVQKGAAYTWLSIDPKICSVILEQLFATDRKHAKIDRRTR